MIPRRGAGQHPANTAARLGRLGGLGDDLLHGDRRRHARPGGGDVLGRAVVEPVGPGRRDGAHGRACGPLLMPSRLDDPPQKVGFVDGRLLRVDGGRGAAEATPEAVYLAMSVRNVGCGHRGPARLALLAQSRIRAPARLHRSRTSTA